MKKIPVIPECYKDLPDNTLMNSRDVCKMFGYRSVTALFISAKNGVIPPEDIKRKSSFRSSYVDINYWKLGTIRKWKNDNSI